MCVREREREKEKEREARRREEEEGRREREAFDGWAIDRRRRSISSRGRRRDSSKKKTSTSNNTNNQNQGFEIAKKHLNPGGVITQWVPLYESDLDTVKSEIATFFEVFPNATIWANNVDGEGYDVVLLGQAEPTKIDLDQVQQRLDREPKVAESLSQVQIRSATELFSTFAGQAPEMRQWVTGAAINRDLNLRLQYLAGMGANNQNAPFIMKEITQYRKFPREIFTGSLDTLTKLRETLGR